MSLINTDAQTVLNFLVSRKEGSEEHPVRFGNVDFWHPIPGFPVGLCYSIPTCQWNVQSVQDDLNSYAETCWEELVAHLQEKQTTQTP